MIKITNKGTYKKTYRFLYKLIRNEPFKSLDHYGRMGVDALSSATPVDTGLSSESWDYRIIKNPPGIVWFNTDIATGVPVVILLQYGHGTGTGGYVQGRDFINPAIQPIFDNMIPEIWKEVTA